MPFVASAPSCAASAAAFSAPTSEPPAAAFAADAAGASASTIVFWPGTTPPQAELALARALPPHEGAVQLATLAADLLAQGHAAHALHARVLRVQALAQLPANQAQAAQEAQAVAADLAHTTPLAAYLPEVWMVLADACRRGGAPDAAARFDAQALAWVQRASSAHVPAAFREGFEQRNRVNAALLRVIA